jgi:hypothetical protein
LRGLIEIDRGALPGGIGAKIRVRQSDLAPRKEKNQWLF